MRYEKLTELGLESYIEKACGGSVQLDSYFSALDSFISSLSEENQKILKNKFYNQSHSQITDLLHEVEVACAFHPKADFNLDSPDLKNGVGIEVKNLNESKQERKRHSLPFFSTINHALNRDKQSQERNLVMNAIKNKVAYHLEKANEQLSGKGLVYLIWDYDNLLHGEDGQIHSESITKEEVQKFIEVAIQDFIRSHHCLIVKNYYFGELRKLVVDSDTLGNLRKSR